MSGLLPVISRYISLFPLIKEVLLFLPSHVFLFLLSLMAYRKKTAITEKLWFIPAVLQFLALLVDALIFLLQNGLFDLVYTLHLCRDFVLPQGLYCAAFAFTGLAFRQNASQPKSSNQYSANYPPNIPAETPPVWNEVPPSGYAPIYQPNTQAPQAPVWNESQVVDSFADEADKIRKYKKLFDEGIITAEEFEAKKKQLLGL